MPKRSIADRKQAIELAVRRQIAEVILFNQWVAQQFGMSASDTQFMHLLNLHGPLTPGRLAELSGLSTGTVTGVLDRLERRRLVRRRVNPADRRSFTIELTAPGERAAARVHEAFAALDDGVLADIPPAAADGFHHVLDALERHTQGRS